MAKEILAIFFAVKRKYTGMRIYLHLFRFAPTGFFTVLFHIGVVWT